MSKIDSAQYPVELYYSKEDGGYIALARDLPGCSAFGKTQAKALAEIQHAIKAWQSAAAAAKNPIPEPSRLPQNQLPSGKVLLRLPRSLHASLIEDAKYDNVSLNQHVVSLLSTGTAVKQISHNLSRAWLTHATGVAWQNWIRTAASDTTFRIFEVRGGPLVEQRTVRPGTLDVLRLPVNEPVVQSEF
jgi:predicted RNase H-like HicB family nuclease